MNELSHEQRKIEQSADLPPGWKAFKSESSRSEPGRWYATAPYETQDVPGQSKNVGFLDDTISAETWRGLVILVLKQQALYDRLTGGSE